ncbi:MAG: alpha/beta fold hydrolase [Candidatus Hydrogenedentota bacterium]|nr:MAG: alpha/beta fold hydrolase [Candidatus Hydrogenedentota bacterium]
MATRSRIKGEVLFRGRTENGIGGKRKGECVSGDNERRADVPQEYGPEKEPLVCLRSAGTETLVEWEKEGLRIRGVFHTPAARRFPAVVMCPGFTGTKTEPGFLFTKAARYFTTLGFGVLRFDYRGSGDSEGDFVDVTIQGEIADAESALRWLESRPEVDSKKLGLLGLSMGGCVAAYVAGDRHDLSSVVLWAPVSNPLRLARERKSREQIEMMRRYGWAPYGGHRIGRALVAELPSLRPTERIALYPGPVLLCHGTEDEAVPPAASEEYRAVLRARPGGDVRTCVEMETVEGASHVFERYDWQRRVIVRTGEWFSRWFG